MSEQQRLRNQIYELCREKEIVNRENAALKQEIEQLKAENERLREIDEREALIANSVRKDRDVWLRKAAENGKFYMDALKEIEQLKAQNAALLECVNFYADSENYAPKFYIGDDPDLPDEIESAIDQDYGESARECIAKLGGERDE